MTRLKVLLACVSVSALAACATPPNDVRLRGPIAVGSPLFDTRTSYGQFLAGQAALRKRFFRRRVTGGWIAP